MRPYQLALILVALAPLASPVALAQGREATAEDRAAIQRCIEGRIAAFEEREKCVGVIADSCLEKGDDPSTAGMADCSRREYLVWDERLNAAYRKLMGELETAQRDELRNMQRAWIAFSNQKCGFFRVMEPEGSIVIPIASYCALKETGRQAAFLEGMLAEGDSR